MSWAKDNKATDWEKVVFSDENPVKPTSKHTPKLHVWGAFSARGTFPLKIFRDNLTGLGYIRILNECLIAQSQVL